MKLQSVLKTIITVFVFAFAAVAPANATDYFHECRTADGLYELNDGILVATKKPDRKSIPYETVREIVVSRKLAYCVSRGKKYESEDKVYVLKFRFIENGVSTVLDALCELASNDLPAAFTCEREVVTLDTSVGGSKATPAKGAATVWTHNGSMMRLEADGADRRFVYDIPRRGMLKAGAKPGDVLFSGRREGQTYVGTAYVFSTACGRVPYKVTGTVAEDERGVTLVGEAPLIAQGCSTKSTRPDELQFDLIER